MRHGKLLQQEELTCDGIRYNFKNLRFLARLRREKVDPFRKQQGPRRTVRKNDACCPGRRSSLGHIVELDFDHVSLTVDASPWKKREPRLAFADRGSLTL